MNDSATGAIPAALPAASAAAAPAAPPPAGYRMVMRFSGSGSEYFRIWIVNLLLTLVTLGLYYPFAKVRRLRYFYGNTKLGGEEFDFHGNPWKMLRGFVLMAALLGAYGLATNVSPWAALVALLLLAGIWPALFRASLQFRLANTSWRGLRFHLEGSLGDAYRALWPMLVVLVIYLGALGFIAPRDAAAQADPSVLAGALTGIGALLAMLLMPWFWFAIKRYQHGHYALGPERTELRSGAAPFYSLFLKAGGLSLLFALPVIALFFWISFSLAGAAQRGTVSPMSFLFVPVLLALAYLGMLIVVGSYTTARMQNLVWSNTRSRSLRFGSRVRVGALFALTAKNWLLIALTLGLYLPFARVARARLLIESVEVTSRHAPHVLTAALRGMGGDAAGDASADLLGFDVGL
jgi:uncharacterized membrane protein YjgN (DUF898 family)